MLNCRSVEQCEIFILALNSIWANAEQSNILAVASSEQALRDFYERQKLPEKENVGGMVYTFKNGPLRNHNPLWNDWHHRSDCAWGSQGWWAEWIDSPPDIPHDIYRVDF